MPSLIVRLTLCDARLAFRIKATARPRFRPVPKQLCELSVVCPAVLLDLDVCPWCNERGHGSTRYRDVGDCARRNGMSSTTLPNQDLSVHLGSNSTSHGNGEGPRLSQTHDDPPPARSRIKARYAKQQMLNER